MSSSPTPRTFTWELASVQASRMKVLALLLGDPNPIHFDPDAVARLGMGDRVVNQGPSTMATVYNLFEQTHPDHRVRSVTFQLLGTVLEGDALTVTAVPSVESESKLDVTVANADGVTVLTAQAVLERRAENAA